MENESDLHKKYKYIFKTILVGDIFVGKSLFTHQLVHKQYEYTLPTTGPEFRTKVIQVRSESVKMQIWDTSGHEAFKSLTKSYYKSSAGVMIIYDITNRESFNNVQSWLEEIREHANPKFTGILVANKNDLEKK